MNINAPSDSVDHYGLVGVVNIEKIASSSYHEHDTANLIQVANGRVALESGSDVSKIHLTAIGGNFDNITVAKANGVEMPDFSRDPVEIPTEGKLVVALQDGTETITESTELDYVWLTAVGIYEQVTLGTASAAGTDYAATSNNATQEQKTTAQQIANNIIATIGEDSYTVTASYNTSTNQWEYNLVDGNGDDTAFAVEAVSVSVSEGSASASITVTGQNATAETSNNTNDTTEMVNEAKNTVVEVTFKGQKTLLGMSEFIDKWNNGDFYDTANPVSIKLVGNCNLKEENWGPIGTWEYPFFGTFDGNEKTISNLTNHAAAASNGNYTHIYYDNHSVGYGETYGFFGIVAGGNTTIKDVTFDSVNINVTNGKNVGAVIGYVPAQNSNFDNHVISTIGSLTLKGVKVTGSVQGKSHVSGLVGKIYTSGAISFTDCTNEASINGAGGYLGGLVGYASSTSASAEFINCKNTGNITGPTGNGAAGLIGKLIIASTGSTLLKDCSNEGIISNTTTANGSLAAGVASLGGAAAVVENCSNSGSVTAGCNAVVGVVFTDNIDVTLKGKITNSGTITQTNSSSNGDACGIIWVSNDKTLTVNNAIILNEGDIVSTKKAGGFQSSEQGVKFISIGTNSFENTGDISATCQNGFAYVGGVFGIMSGAVESKETMPFSINVHDCSITATGKGADAQYDDNNMSWSCAGGVAGQIGGKGFVFNSVVVQNVSISAVGQNDNTYNYAGGFVGMIRMNAQENKVNTLTNATILTGNTINATHKGVIAGCSYDSQGGPGDIYNNALNYSGSFASGDVLGQSWSEGTISLVE